MTTIELQLQFFRILLMLRVLRLARWFTKLERFKVIVGTTFNKALNTYTNNMIATIYQIAPTMGTFAGVLIVRYNYSIFNGCHSNIS